MPWKRTILHIRDASPKTIIIDDFKRGDVDLSTSRYVKAMFEQRGFDAVTVNPWGGIDTIAPG